MACSAKTTVKRYSGMSAYYDNDEAETKKSRLQIEFNVTDAEMRSAKTRSGKNYNGGTLPSPYMDNENWKGWFMLGIGISYLLVLFC